MDAKRLVEKIVKEKCWSNFKIKEIVSAVKAKGSIISDVWCSEVLKSLGYVYDRSNKIWYYPMPKKKVISSKDMLNDFAESQLKLRAATEEIDRLLVKNKELKEENINTIREYNQLYFKYVDYEKEHQELVKKYKGLLEFLLAVNNGILNGDYCSKCKKSGKCSRKNRVFNKPCKVLIDFVNIVNTYLDEYHNHYGNG